jgi:hypothetical protein
MSTYNTTVKFAELPVGGNITNETDTSSVVQSSDVKEGSGNTAAEDVTVFVDDGNVVRNDTSAVSHISRSILQMNDTNFDEQSIKTFLARPIILKQGVFDITDTYTFFNSQSMPYTALQLPSAIMWREKLAGIFGIRMDMRFRIVVNANRFQQGRYIMSFMPLASPVRSTSGLKELAFNNAHMATLVQRTTVPRVEIDLANDTVGELVVPFMSCRTFYNLTDILSSVDNNSLGFLNIYPYSPLVSPAGSTTAGYTVYVSFENITLFGAASAQSGLGRRKKDVQNAELSNKMNGPISSVSSALSKGFKEFAHIPLLSTYANSISWVADRVTSVASVFGWSKPNQGDSQVKFNLLQAPNHNTVDGDSDARPLSFLSKPGVTAIDGLSGTSYDEMDFSYIVRKPAWFKTMTWSNIQTAGSTITDGTFFVYPYVQTTVAGRYNFQPVAFVAWLFQYWRGSLRYRFKFVKTEFHSGRLSIAFFPASGTAYTGNAAYVHRIIVDIREMNEVEFVVPYISPNPWSYTNTGSIVVSIVDPLVNPATVSNSITVLCEISGGDDFEVAVPTTQNINFTPSILVPQSGLENVNELITMNIGNSTVVADPNVSSSTTIGDKVSSFRALLKRYTPIRNTDNSIAGGSLLNGPTVQMVTDAIYTVNTTPPARYWRADAYSIVCSCYAMSRGGVRIRDVINKNMFSGTNIYGPSISKVSTQSEVSNLFFGNTIQLNPANFENAWNSHVHIQDLQLNGVITLENPQYTPTYARAVCDQWNIQGAQGTAIGPLASTTNQQVFISLPVSMSSPTAVEGESLHNIYRALADDADFSVFISVPPMFISGATVQPRLGFQ